MLNTIWLIALGNNFLFFRFITLYGLFISFFLKISHNFFICLIMCPMKKWEHNQIFYFYLITVFHNCKHKSHSFASSVNLTTLFVGCYSVKITAVTMCKNKIKLSNYLHDMVCGIQTTSIPITLSGDGAAAQQHHLPQMTRSQVSSVSITMG
jgi:hypothetical protein